jgi:hypothetical protein
VDDRMMMVQELLADDPYPAGASYTKPSHSSGEVTLKAAVTL